MSKTVIVFSTYYNSPFGDNHLFSKISPSRFTSRKLCDFLWDDFKAITKYGNSSVGWKDVSDYLTDEMRNDMVQEAKRQIEKNNQELSCFINSHKEFNGYKDKAPNEIFSCIQKLKIAAKMNSDEESKKLLEKEDYKTLIDLVEKCRRDVNDYIIEILKETNSLKLTNSIKDKDTQKTFSFGFPSGYSIDSDICKSKPWLYFRFSFYEIKDSIDNEEIYIYAVWPLDPQGAKDNTDGWVEALTDQFLICNDNEDADSFYLILHNKDIESNSTFKVLKIDKIGSTTRFLALFQHSDWVGDLLEEKVNLNDVKNEVEAHIYERGVLFPLLDMIKEGDGKSLKTRLGEVKDAIKDERIKEIVRLLEDDMSDNTPNQDDMTIELINLLNKQIKLVEK